MKKDYMIWVTYHKDEQVAIYGLKNDEHHTLFPSHKDADGENINIMNPVYSEMVTMWYVWKNNIKSEYVGFEHYRRHLNVQRLPGKGECQVYMIGNFGDMTIYDQYSQYHNRCDMDTMLSILDEKYGNKNAYSLHIRESHVFIANCTFIMKWSDFTRLCRFLFPLLEEFGKRNGIEGNDEKSLEKWRQKALKDFVGKRTEYQTRVLSFLAERLISAWITKHMTPFNGIDVALVHYNTPELTKATIHSLNKTTPGCKVWVFDNSDKMSFKVKIPNVSVIDNTKGQIKNFEECLEHYADKDLNDVSRSNFGSAKHCMSVDCLFDILPKGFVLIDSDVLFMKSIKAFVDRNVAVTGVEFAKHGVVLFQPFLCWINVPMLREKGIGYFNGEKMWALSNKEPNCWYDTGAWLHEEVIRYQLPWKHDDIWRYIIHFGHGSWKHDKNRENAWLEKFKSFYE